MEDGEAAGTTLAAATGAMEEEAAAAGTALAAVTGAVAEVSAVAAVGVTVTPTGMTPLRPRLAPGSSRSLRTRTGSSYVRKTLPNF